MLELVIIGSCYPVLYPISNFKFCNILLVYWSYHCVIILQKLANANIQDFLFVSFMCVQNWKYYRWNYKLEKMHYIEAVFVLCMYSTSNRLTS
jgi:hypothetical protein